MRFHSFSGSLAFDCDLVTPSATTTTTTDESKNERNGSIRNETAPYQTKPTSGLSSKQKEVYRNVLLRDIDMVNGTGGGGNAGRTVILNIVMQLRKCCNHPYLFAGVEDRKLDPLGDHLIINCGKVIFVLRCSCLQQSLFFFIIIFC